MSELVDRDLHATSPFVGLRPSSTTGSLTGAARHRTPNETARRAMMATMPILLVGSLAASTLGIAPLGENPKPASRDRADASDPRLADARISAAPTADTTEPQGTVEIAAVTPQTYVVRAGDTVSAISERYGLSTASVLALNGLGWKTLIFPGQTLKLTKATAAVTPPAAPSTAPASAAPVATAPVATPPVAATPAPATGGTYVIVRGDTITSIAKKFGLPIATVLTANGLSASSIIYAGRTLVIPGVQLASVGPVTPVTPAGPTVAGLTPSMQANARIIIQVGRSLGVPNYGIVIALATAAQESGVQNLDYGDRDSVGLFQQRPSTGWGTVAQLTQPAYAAALFYGGPSNPNKGRTRGLLDIPGWQSMTVTQAAQAVQISGAPNAYAKWESSARAWLAQLG